MIKKRILCILMIISYFLLAFLLIYSNVINPDYEGYLEVILTIAVVTIWIVCSFLFADVNNNSDQENKKIDDILTYFALLPFYVLLVIPLLIGFLVFSIVNLIRNNMNQKCKVLISKGYILKRRKQNKRSFVFLSKNNFVIKFHEFDTYVISNDNGMNFVDLRESTLLSDDDRMVIANLIYKYESCDFRDKDIYEPTTKILTIVSKYV